MPHSQRELNVDGLKAYLAEPERKNGAGVLVLPTIVGIQDHLKSVCSWLNDAGFTALAWDPFSHWTGGDAIPEKATWARTKLDDRDAHREQRRWLDYMYSDLGLGKVGVIGFCLGGRQQLSLCAVEPRLHACAAYHPSISMPAPPEQLDTIAMARDIPCPVQVLYPGQDHITNRATFEALRESLESRTNAPTIIHVYPDADHGFTEGPSPLTGEDRSAKAANRAAHASAWPQTIALFNACLV
ncbi:MAG TPA: dienelactone hydrolase family protein [Chloroflexota bacterium]|nr:dienelactone hydrolase family protein [Chloroflexota bacterium]